MSDGRTCGPTPGRLLLTHKNENLYNAYALEVAALFPAGSSRPSGSGFSVG
jgi:hypothetical protein